MTEHALTPEQRDAEAEAIRKARVVDHAESVTSKPETETHVASIADMLERWKERAAAVDPVSVEQAIELERLERLSELIERRIPSRFRGATITEPKVRDWLRAYLDGSDESLVLAGPTGTGKTHHVFALARALLEHDRTAWTYRKVATLLDELRPNGDAGDRRALARMIEAPLLLLDDLGAHNSSTWTDEKLGQIIDSRYEDERPTVVTTNLTADALTEVLGDRISSRLATYRVLVFGGPDRRRGGRA